MRIADKYSQELKHETERVLAELKERGISMRAAALNSGLSYAMVQDMKDGRIPGPEHLIRFAKKYGEDVPRWLRMCGYGDIAEIVNGSPKAESVHESRADSDSALLAEAERIGFHEDLTDWGRLSESDRENLRGIIRRMLGEERSDPRDQG